MPNINGTGNLIDELNRCMPAASHAKLGTLLEEIITKHNAVLAKLDAIGAATTAEGIATAAGTDNVSGLTITSLTKR